MIALTSRDKLVHKASWHDPSTAEGKRINEHHAKLLAADYAATKERLISDAVRCRLGKIPAVDDLKERMEFRTEGQKIGTQKLYWLVLDGEAIALLTEPVTTVQGYRFVMTWHFKSLVTNWEKN